MADINKQISIFVLALKVQFWSGYNPTDLNKISKCFCLHQQVILNHPCSCLCPSAARNRKWALEDQKVREELIQSSIICQIPTPVQ